jgi:hypothetical protein
VSEAITSLLCLCIQLCALIGHNSLILRITSQEYSADNVTVTVEWTQRTLYATYHVTVLPMVPIDLESTGSTSCQLTISYNAEYNLTVDTTAPCRPNTAVLIRLKYGEACPCMLLSLINWYWCYISHLYFGLNKIRRSSLQTWFT